VDKEDDRVRHIETLNSQTGPVFITYRANAALNELFARKITEQPAIDFTARDGVRHTSWVIADDATIQKIDAEFARIPFLYIADGHHRSAAAARALRASASTRSSPISANCSGCIPGHAATSSSSSPWRPTPARR